MSIRDRYRGMQGLLRRQSKRLGNHRMVSGPILPLIVTSAEFIACEVSEITAEATTRNQKRKPEHCSSLLYDGQAIYQYVIFLHVNISAHRKFPPFISITFEFNSTPSGSKAIRAYILRTTATA